MERYFGPLILDTQVFTLVSSTLVLILCHVTWQKIASNMANHSYDELHDTMIQLTLQVEALDIRLEKAERTVEQLKKQGALRTAPTLAKKKRTSKARSTTLPSDLVTWRSFARLHESYGARCDEGHQGRSAVVGAWVLEAQRCCGERGTGLWWSEAVRRTL